MFGRSTSTGRGRLLVVASIVLMTVTACSERNDASNSGPERPTDEDGVVLWAKPQEVSQLDPALTEFVDAEIFNEVYDTLVTINAENEVQPSVATSWEQTSPTTYVVQLRDDVVFSNHRAMTSDDVVGSLLRTMDPDVGSIWGGQLNIKSATPTGPTEVTIELLSPKASFLATLANLAAAVLPMEELDAGDFDPKEELLGSGPYEVKEHVQGQSWSLVRNPDYWGEPADNAELSIKIVNDDSARIAALGSGSAMVATFDTPDSVNLLAGRANIETKVVETNDYYRIDVNAKSSLFADERLRHALALSVDRQRIVDTALAGLGAPSAASAPSFGVCPADEMPYATPNPDEAKRLVEEAGATGETVTIIASSFITTFAPIAQVIQQDLQKAGLQVKILQLEPAEWVKRVFNGTDGDFDAAISLYGGYGDPAIDLAFYNATKNGFTQAYQLDDPQMNDLIVQSEETTGAARDAALRAACERAAENANVIPVVTRPVVVAYRSDLIAPEIADAEGYGIPLRYIAKYRVFE